MSQINLNDYAAQLEWLPDGGLVLDETPSGASHFWAAVLLMSYRDHANRIELFCESPLPRVCYRIECNVYTLMQPPRAVQPYVLKALLQLFNFDPLIPLNTTLQLECIRLDSDVLV